PFFSFFLNAPAPTEIYTLSLHDALPISVHEADHRQGVYQYLRFDCGVGLDLCHGFGVDGKPPRQFRNRAERRLSTCSRISPQLLHPPPAAEAGARPCSTCRCPRSEEPRG